MMVSPVPLSPWPCQVFSDDHSPAAEPGFSAGYDTQLSHGEWDMVTAWPGGKCVWQCLAQIWTHLPAAGLASQGLPWAPSGRGNWRGWQREE